MSKAKAHNKIYGKACFCLTFLFDKSQNQRAPCCLICGPCILRRPFFQTLKHESSSGWAEAIHYRPGEGSYSKYYILSKMFQKFQKMYSLKMRPSDPPPSPPKVALPQCAATMPALWHTSCLCGAHEGAFNF